MQSRHRSLGAIIVVGAALVIAALTLRPGGGTGTVHPLWCLSCVSLGSRAGADLLLNTLLFVPFAFGLWHLGFSMRRTMATVVAATVLIELLQMTVIAGRYASIGDVAANTIGGAIGYALGPRWPSIVFPRPALAARLTAIAAAIWWLVVGVSAFGMAPDLSRTTYRVSWNPAQLADRRLTGQVLAATANGEPLAPGQYDGRSAVAEGLQRGAVRIEATMLANGRSNERDSRVDIEASDGTGLLMLGQDDRDLLFRVRLRARDLRLRAPSARAADALPSKADVRRTAAGFEGDTIRLSGELADHRLLLMATGNAVSARQSLTLGPELGWTMLLPLPAHVPAFVLALIGALWLALPLLPVGYWGARWDDGFHGRRPGGFPAWGSLLLLATMVAIGAALIPAIADSAPVSLPGWLAATASAIGGWVLGKASRRVVAGGGNPRPAGATNVR